MLKRLESKTPQVHRYLIKTFQNLPLIWTVSLFLCGWGKRHVFAKSLHEPVHAHCAVTAFHIISLLSGIPYKTMRFISLCYYYYNLMQRRQNTYKINKTRCWVFFFKNWTISRRISHSSWSAWFASFLALIICLVEPQTSPPMISSRSTP